jgi:hypothetical protein
MPELSKWGFPRGVYPLKSWRNRPASDVRHWAPYLPEVSILIGTDDQSAGLTISAWTASLGEFANVETLYAKRWVDKPQSVQEALLVAQKGIAAAIAELFPQPEE